MKLSKIPLFKFIKIGYRFAKEVRIKEKTMPTFGRDPGIFGVENIQEKEKREGPKGEKTLEIRVEYPKEGGRLTHIEGEKHPFPGFPDKEEVLDIGMIKRMVPAAINAYYPYFSRHILDPKKYCRSVREVYRLFNILIEREEKAEGRTKLTDIWPKVRDMVCVILEFDNAYRFRAQDIAAEANIEELKLDEGDRYWAARTAQYKWGFLDKKSKEEPKKCACIGSIKGQDGKWRIDHVESCHLYQARK